MNRLTERLSDNLGAVVKLDYGLPEALEKLAAYEDTGLEPEDVLKCEEYRSYVRERFPNLQHIDVLSKADAEDRLIVLPCKVGDTVYICGNRNFAVARVTAIYIDGIGGMFDLDVRSDIETVTGFKHYICRDYTFEDIGKTVFLTREERKRRWEGVIEHLNQGHGDA